MDLAKPSILIVIIEAKLKAGANFKNRLASDPANLKSPLERKLPLNILLTL